jgi:hypothetical protein
VPGECVLAAPAQVDSLAAAVKGTTATAEGGASRFEIFAGAALLPLGDKTMGNLAGIPFKWKTIFNRGFGIDGQVVIRRPQRAAASLATGDTFVVVRGTFETYGDKEDVFDDLTILGGWLEGRTLLSALDAGQTLRPYIQYGGGVMRYSEMAVGPVSWWDSTMALGWRTALGLELRTGRLGLYVEGGIQVVGPPDVPDYYYSPPNAAEIALRSAQDLVTYPIRFGAMIGF